MQTRKGEAPLISQAGPESEDHARDELLRLLDDHEQGITNYLRMLLADSHVVSDWAQDTLLRAHEHLRNGKPVTTKWLYTVARNRAMDEHRKRKRLQWKSEGDDVDSASFGIDSAVSEDVREALA